MAYRRRYSRTPPRKPRGVVVQPLPKRDVLAERKAFLAQLGKGEKK